MSSRATDPRRLLAIRQSLSPARLHPFDQAAGDKGQRSLKLYEWNVAVSAACYIGLHAVEVTLRNSLHAQLAAWHAANGFSGEWIDDPSGALGSRCRQDIVAAKLRLRKEGKRITADGVVSELMFGFWRYLLSSRYEDLWTHALRHAFPHLHPQRRKDIAEPVERLHKLRNRIAHHEPIHRRNLVIDHTDMMTVLGAISPFVQDWAQGIDGILDLFARRPGTCTPKQRSGIVQVAPGVWRVAKSS